MTRAGYPLKLPRSVKAAAARLAREDGVSLNQWIAAAVAEKVGAVEAAAVFLRRRAGDASAEELLRLLHEAPDRPPATDDRAG
jgi:HicB family